MLLFAAGLGLDLVPASVLAWAYRRERHEADVWFARAVHWARLVNDSDPAGATNMMPPPGPGTV